MEHSYLKLRSYRAHREKDGTYTIFNVPLFSEVPTYQRNNPIPLDRKWHEASAKINFKLQDEGHFIPLNIGHQHLFNLVPRRVGFVRITNVGQVIQKGQQKSAIFGDFVGLSYQTYQKIKQLKYPYYSAEINGDFTPGIWAVALLTEPPHFPFPIFGKVYEEELYSVYSRPVIVYNSFKQNKDVTDSGHQNKTHSFSFLFRGEEMPEQEQAAEVIESKVELPAEKEEEKPEKEEENSIDLDDRFDRIESALSSMCEMITRFGDLLLQKAPQREHESPEPQMKRKEPMSAYSAQLGEFQGTIDALKLKLAEYDVLLPEIKTILTEQTALKNQKIADTAIEQASLELTQAGYRVDEKFRTALAEVFAKTQHEGLKSYVAQFKRITPPEDDRALVQQKAATPINPGLTPDEQLDYQVYQRWQKDGYIAADCSFERFLRLKEQQNQQNKMRGY